MFPQIPAKLPPAITKSHDVAEFIMSRDMQDHDPAGPVALAWGWALTGQGLTPITLEEEVPSDVLPIELATASEEGSVTVAISDVHADQGLSAGSADQPWQRRLNTGAASGLEFPGHGQILAAAEPVRRGGGSAGVIHPSP
jgi:hypothetical protein